MTSFTRYGVYVLPEGAFYAKGAAWLGWDAVTGQMVDHPRVDGLPLPVETLTETPRKYGFHGTLKPPFRLAEGAGLPDLRVQMDAVAARLAPVEIPRLIVKRLGGFVALVPEMPVPALADLAATVVERLDSFRAPLTKAELARRRSSQLSPRQEALLTQWGYPYVMEEFRFHLTLSGRVLASDADALAARLALHFADTVPTPFTIGDLALVGEGEDGRFRLIHRYPLAG